MKTENDKNVFDFWKLSNGNCNVYMRKYEGLDDDCDNKDTLPAHLGAFIISNGKRIMKNFIKEINCFNCNTIYYGDNDSLYKEEI